CSDACSGQLPNASWRISLEEPLFGHIVPFPFHRIAPADYATVQELSVNLVQCSVHQHSDSFDDIRLSCRPSSFVQSPENSGAVCTLRCSCTAWRSVICLQDRCWAQWIDAEYAAESGIGRVLERLCPALQSSPNLIVDANRSHGAPHGKRSRCAN